ncbi:MAG TPA: ABC transporter permease, partial [Parvularculaceae bacterium]|nr:ABC transporter permease [Parvularculaceae bacterium]
LFSRPRRARDGFFEDIAAGFKMSHVWRAFAWDEMQQRYRRSILGILWIFVSYAVFVGAIAFFFAGFAQMGSRRFTIYVALGFSTFQFLVGNITDGCQVFSSSGHWIKSATLPYSIYVYKSVFRSIFTFALQLAVTIMIMAYFGERPTWQFLLALPALAIFLLDAVALQYLLGLFGARYRDVPHLIGTLTRVLFFMTPIIWVREEMHGVRAVFADFNPLTHFLEIFRAPLMGAAPRLVSWEVALVATGVIWLAAAVAAWRMRRRLPFWV